MKVGACGIACEVCGHFIKGVCEGCVAGTDEGVSEKLDFQKKKLGLSCPLLECAFSNKIGYCFTDCAKFPCDVIYRGFPYYCKGFLDIFERE